MTGSPSLNKLEYNFYIYIQKVKIKNICRDAKKISVFNDALPEISKMKYRNRIPEPGTTISSKKKLEAQVSLYRSPDINKSS